MAIGSISIFKKEKIHFEKYSYDYYDGQYK